MRKSFFIVVGFAAGALLIAAVGSSTKGGHALFQTLTSNVQQSQSPEPSESPEATPSPEPSESPEATPSPEPSESPEPARSPEPKESPTAGDPDEGLGDDTSHPDQESTSGASHEHSGDGSTTGTGGSTGTTGSTENDH